ncbi:MAG: hypothetical protein FWG65_12775 [Turicibacter sp.]|nr:hypothetical protein [Turicibacter sp.]
MENCYFYAQKIGDIVVAISQLGSEIDDPNMIQCTCYDTELIGCIHNADGSFTKPTQPKLEILDEEVEPSMEEMIKEIYQKLKEDS